MSKLTPQEGDTLHDGIVRLLFPVKPIHETADEILTLIYSKMPEKEKHTAEEKRADFYYREGKNAYHDSVKSILKGRME